jgi:phospholipase/carboxylesterase
VPESLEHDPRSEPALSRRDLLGTGLAAAASLFLAGCGVRRDDPPGLDTQGAARSTAGPPSGGKDGIGGGGNDSDHDPHLKGRLLSRPGEPIGGEDTSPGLREFDVAPGRRALLLVPTTYRPDRATRFVLALHGISGLAEGAMRIYAPAADDDGLLVLAPQAARGEWDMFHNGYGQDVRFIDAALTKVFDGFRVDPTRMLVSGFSEGASYSLTMGLINGDLFTNVASLSPEYIGPGARHGDPRIYISHGTEDRVFPIEETSRKIVPKLRDEGYRVHYHEYVGRHELNLDIAAEATRWFLRTSS